MLLLAACVLGQAPPAPPAKEGVKDTPFYPLKVGTAWVYRVGPRTFNVRVVAHELIGKEWCARLEGSEGERKQEEHLTVRADGIYRVRENGQGIEPPVCVLKLPPEAGATWTWAAALAGQKLTGTFTLADEELAVPAGKYKAVRAASADLTLGDWKAPLAVWYAAGVGPVRQRLVVNGKTVLLELQSFKAAK
jgi:hypothetical protein